MKQHTQNRTYIKIRIIKLRNLQKLQKHTKHTTLYTMIKEMEPEEYGRM